MTLALSPPCDLEAEGSVISAVLFDPGVFDDLALLLRPEHFYADANRRIWEAMTAITVAKRTPDAVTVSGWLRDAKLLGTIGGPEYLAQLAGYAFVLKPEEQARRILDKFRLRSVISVSQQTSAEAYGCPENVEAFIQGAEARLYQATMADSRPTRSITGFELMGACLAEVEAKGRRERSPGASTGFPALDRRIGWLRPGRLYVVAARPGMGKTSVLLQAGRSVMTSAGERRGFFCSSLEMPREDIGNRIISQETTLDTRSIDSGFIKKSDWPVLSEKTQMVSRWPLIVDDTPGITVSTLRGLVRRAARKFERDMGTKLGLVGIDYLQLMGRGDCPKGRTQNEEIEWISSSLLALAKEFDVPIMLLSQLNRECEKRPNKRPQLSDLRSSGAIEQDAWSVMFLYREDVYRGQDEQKDYQAEIIIGKARSGQPGTVNLSFIPHCAKFVPIAGYDDPEDQFAVTAMEFADYGEEARCP